MITNLKVPSSAAARRRHRHENHRSDVSEKKNRKYLTIFCTKTGPLMIQSWALSFEKNILNNMAVTFFTQNDYLLSTCVNGCVSKMLIQKHSKHLGVHKQLKKIITGELLK